MIENGNLSLTNAAMAQSVIQKIEKTDDKKLTVHEKQEIVQLVCNKTQKQAQIALTEIHPVASLPKTIEKPITVELTQIQVLLNKETYENLQTLKSLYSHKIPDGDLNKIFELLISSAVQNHPINKISRKNENEMKTQKSESKKSLNSTNNVQSEIHGITSQGKHPVQSENEIEKMNLICEKNVYPAQQVDSKMHDSEQMSRLNQAQINNTKIDRKAKYPSTISTKTNQTRHVRISVKRNIYQRANGQCEFVNQQGHRCQSRHQLEFDHIQSASHGGISLQENIQLLCRFHNQMKVKNTHGFLYAHPTASRLS